MLCLSRCEEESIVIDMNRLTIEQIIELHARGELNIEVRVLGIRGRAAKLGVAAHRAIPVHRREVFDAIERQTTKPAA